MSDSAVLTTDTRIRPVTLDDLDAIAGIYAHYVVNTVITFDETPPDSAFWRQRHHDLAERGMPFLAAEIDGEVAGYAYAAQWKPKPAYRYSVENTIYLAPGRTGRGLGRVLLDALITHCAAAGFRRMIAVIADSGNDSSVALHTAFGFTQVGRLTAVGYKHDRWVDTVIMQRSLQ